MGTVGEPSAAPVRSSPACTRTIAARNRDHNTQHVTTGRNADVLGEQMGQPARRKVNQGSKFGAAGRPRRHQVGQQPQRVIDGGMP